MNNNPERNYYLDIDSMWIDMMNECLIYGRRLDSREGGCFETIGWSGTLQAGASTVLRNNRRALSASYAGAENLWYMALTGDISMIEMYAPQYPRWANDGIMLGAVGRRMGGTDPRLAYGSQIQSAITLLREHPETRQCVMAMWEQSDLEDAIDGDKLNVPCYLTFQAFIREGPNGPQLDFVTNMRSNDVWLGAPYDIYAFQMIQRTIASELEVAVGTYTHHVGSLHVYEKYLAGAKAAIEEHESRLRNKSYIFARPNNQILTRDQCGFGAWKQAIECEDHVRGLLQSDAFEAAKYYAESGILAVDPGPVRDCLITALTELFRISEYDFAITQPCDDVLVQDMLDKEMKRKADK